MQSGEFSRTAARPSATGLRVLIVEDSPEDTELVLRELRRGGFEATFERVETERAFAAALAKGEWDVILADYSLPQYSGLHALRAARDAGSDVPFILVSGKIGELVAVDAMRAGAQDYVLKDQLARLCPAIEREVREAQGRAEQRRLQEALIASDRMASAGMLASGVAHEINNPLAVVIANLDYVATAVGDVSLLAPSVADRGDDVVRWLRTRLQGLDEPLRDAAEAVGRIREIVRDVKLFSRPNADVRGGVNVERVMDSSIRMAQNEIRHRAQLVRDYGHVPEVEANESRLGEALLNLIVNAAQSIPEGNAQKNEIRVTTRCTGDRVVLEIKDSGSGIAKEHVPRIFDAFFTTRPLGTGRGLGLAICRLIVTDLKGDIAVESEVGKGSVFRVTLPVRAPGAAGLGHAARAPSAPRKARVLIIDDEEALGRALQRSLSKHHEVSVLGSGRDALSRIGAGERFDVIVCDLMMPDITGMEIHEHLLASDPEQAAVMVFVTGGAFTAAAQTFLDDVPNPRLEKPIEVSRLIDLIDELSREARSTEDDST